MLFCSSLSLIFLKTIQRNHERADNLEISGHSDMALQNYEISVNAENLKKKIKILWGIKIIATVLLLIDWVIDLEDPSGAFGLNLDTVQVTCLVLLIILRIFDLVTYNCLNEWSDRKSKLKLVGVNRNSLGKI